MSNNFEITCPKCKASFNAEEAFKQHFEKEKEKEIVRIKTEERKIAQLEADKKIKVYLEQSEKEKLKEQKDAEKKAKDTAEKEKELFIKTFKANEEKKIRDDVELKSKKEASNKDKIIQELKDQFEKINKERSIENERNKKQIEELVSLNAKTKSEIKGEVQEELIQDYLKKKISRRQY